MIKDKASVTGVVRVHSAPDVSHMHDGRLYYLVVVSSKRAQSPNKRDFLRLYYDPEKFDKSIMKVGEVIYYEGYLVKSKLTETLNDIAVAVTNMRKADNESSDTGSVISLEGRVIDVSESLNGPVSGIKPVSMLVAVESNDNKRVVVKLTGVGRTAEIIKSLSSDDNVRVIARIYSYKIKNKSELEGHHLHDSRVISIERLK